jgi:hypothetical protein
VVTPEFPTYHWYVGEVPDADTLNVAVVPLLIVTEAGWAVIAGAVMTVAVAAVEFAVPAALDTRTQ